MENKDFYTLLDISKLTGLSLTTIRRYSASKRLKTIHFSRRTVRVSRDVLESIMTNGLPELIPKEVTNCQMI